MRLAAFLLVLASNMALAQSPVESWTALEAPLLQVGRTTTLFHSQLRLRTNQERGFYYARFGPNLRVRLTNGFTLVSGFWYAAQIHERPRGWEDQHRYWTGFERPFRAGAGALSVRWIYEHWFGGPRPNDNRTRWLWVYRRPVGSQGLTLGGGTETFIDNHGFMAERLIANVGLPFSRQFTVEAGYMWDKRLERVGGARHMLTTTIRPRLRDR